MTETVEHNYDWLIIFLVYNNNYYDLKNQDTTEYYTMEEQTKYILNQVRHTRHNESIKTIFVEAEIKNYRRKNFATLSMLYKKKGSWLSAVNRVWRDENPIDILTTGESLLDILKKLREDFPANKHMIITAGHGSIVGINYYIPELKQKASREKNKNLEPVIKKKFPIANKIKYQTKLKAKIKVENESLLFLANEEIGMVLKKVFPDKKVDVMVAYNCLMQNIFTQFSLRKTVDWLVAPLSGISIPGFNYRHVLNEISKDPSINGETASKLFINSIREGNRYSSFKNDIESTWKLSAVKLDNDKLNKLQKDFDAVFKIINTLSVKDASIISVINEVLKYLFSYSIYCLKSIQIFDLGSFLASLSDKIKNADDYPGLANAIAELQKTLHESALSRVIFTGVDFYKSESDIIHYDSRESNFNKIADVGLLFPINKTGSDLLNLIYNKKKPKDKYSKPDFLKSKSYAMVVNKIHSLVPMNL